MDRKRLIDYLPHIMQNFKEIKEITNAEQKEVDLIDGEISKVLNNAFIEDCDEYGIQKYENLLGITPNAEDTLDSRKSMVLLQWNNHVPYTYQVLLNKLNILCGVNNYDILSDLANYKIDFTMYVQKESELITLLEKILPENISYTVYLAEKNVGVNRVCVIYQEDEIFNLRQVII